MYKKILMPEDILVVVDTREQKPLDLGTMKTTVGTLPTGDYSIAGLTASEIAIERKGDIHDLLACVGKDRDRFDREILRMRAYRTKYVVCEFSWHDVLAGHWRSKLTPDQVMGSIVSWMNQGIPFVMAGNRALATRFVRRILYQAARKRWEEVYEFVLAHEDAAIKKRRGKKKPVEIDA